MIGGTRVTVFCEAHTPAPDPTLTGGHSCGVTGICPAIRATGVASIEYAIVFRGVRRPTHFLDSNPRAAAAATNAKATTAAAGREPTGFRPRI